MRILHVDLSARRYLDDDEFTVSIRYETNAEAFGDDLVVAKQVIDCSCEDFDRLISLQDQIKDFEFRRNLLKAEVIAMKAARDELLEFFIRNKLPTLGFSLSGGQSPLNLGPATEAKDKATGNE